MSTTQNPSTRTPHITETFLQGDTQPVPMPMPELQGDTQPVPMPMPELENDAVPTILVGDTRGTSEDTAMLWPDDCYPPKVPFLPVPCPLTGNTFTDVTVDIGSVNIYIDNAEPVYLVPPEILETPDPIPNLV